jgi:hypothetical protein
MAQRGASKHDQWRGYMTVLVFNHGIVKFISILAAVVRPMIEFDADQLQDCFRQAVQWPLASRYQLLTLSALDLDRVYHILHSLLQENDTYCLPEGKQ